MKKIILILSLLCSSFSLLAQSETTFTQECKWDNSNITPDNMYVGMKEWAMMKFAEDGCSIASSDREIGVIVCKGTFRDVCSDVYGGNITHWAATYSLKIKVDNNMTVTATVVLDQYVRSRAGSSMSETISPYQESKKTGSWLVDKLNKESDELYRKAWDKTIREKDYLLKEIKKVVEEIAPSQTYF